MKKEVAYFGVFTALAFIFSYIEAIIPFYIGIPGVKLGLANIVVVVAMYLMGGKSAFTLSIVRIILVGFTFGNMNTMIYSLAGGILSFLVMIIAKKVKCFSIIGVSILGGTFHNIGQILVAAWMVRTVGLAYYLPILLVSGVITGLLIGVLADTLVRRLKEITKI